ncbi:ornithine decarboxylase-like isoform X1 [Mercenaria mercenaria]|uniref:ornithine decarboxylase-like isoform X1 n=1 Tax=Mercenaria mercenaria TaxID=6596 RepID=UPI00234F3FD8|nr:ornithine decarboxylase-like isoform X1 [Mercenaria mercenaria]XP_045184367.2 ornithine decarboxylase-like isoform X1 [Mercenaria mercenaria]
MEAYIQQNIPVNLHPERRTKLDVIQKFVADMEREGKDEHFLVCDIGDIIKKYQQWSQLLPRVKLFYAVKCNTDRVLLQILSDLGASFDCASKMEIEKVLGLGVSPDRVIYTHPHKLNTSLIYAERHSVSLMTFDSEIELHKIKSLHPTARLVLRILLFEQFEADEKFGSKFGCPSDQTRDLLQLAKELELVVVGVSFHVGSGIKDARAYIAAIQQSRKTFQIAQEVGFIMNVLDIGGGFPGAQDTSDFFHEIASVVNETLNDLFPADEGVDIIGEPGAYVATSAYSSLVNIIGKRWCSKKPLLTERYNKPEKNSWNSCEEDRNTYMYYLNDSVFGNFLDGTLYTGCTTYIPKRIKTTNDTVSYGSILWGFTCAGNDCVNPSIRLPELDVGEWLYFEDMGAYTLSMASNFNGLETPEIKYYCSEDLWLQVYPKTITISRDQTRQ